MADLDIEDAIVIDDDDDQGVEGLLEDLIEGGDQEQEDGSFIIEEEELTIEEAEFSANLAEFLDETILSNIVSELCELIDDDKESRSKRDSQYAEGIRRTGLGDDAPGGAQFEGASKTVHPALAEACVDYAAAAIKETFPPDGPVKIHNLSQVTDPNFIERAENKRDFMNWQLTDQIVEYKSELEVLYTQQPLGGSQYLKVWFDTTKNRVRVEFVPIDKVYLPSAASSFMVAQRVTIVDEITRYELDRRMESGLYRELIGLTDPQMPEESKASGS